MEGHLVLVSRGSVGLLDPGFVVVSGLCRMWRTKSLKSDTVWVFEAFSCEQIGEAGVQWGWKAGSCGPLRLAVTAQKEPGRAVFPQCR